MKTSHLISVTTRFSPFSATSKTPRSILALLPPNAYKTMAIKATQLPRTSTLPASLEIAFKDGKVLKYQWTGQNKTTDGSNNVAASEKEAVLQDIVSEVDRHTRILGRKEELSG